MYPKAGGEDNTKPFPVNPTAPNINDVSVPASYLNASPSSTQFGNPPGYFPPQTQTHHQANNLFYPGMQHNQRPADGYGGAMATLMYPITPNNPPSSGPPPCYGGGPQYPTGYCPPPAYQRPIHVHHQQQVYTQSAPMQTASFDAGARFGGKGGGSMSIPPPPPGYAPTAAQAASMQGQVVVMKKKSRKFW